MSGESLGQQITAALEQLRAMRESGDEAGEARWDYLLDRLLLRYGQGQR